LRLPGLVADALPDDFGNALIAPGWRREASRPREVTALDRLSYMGGALGVEVPAGARLARRGSAARHEEPVEAARIVARRLR
jgi:serine/threonine-protein kinase HipA